MKKKYEIDEVFFYPCEVADPKLWRFTSMVLPEVDPNIDYRWLSPIPVKSDNKCVGSANLFVQDGQLFAECFVDYAIPERLDVQADTKVWTLPNVTWYAVLLGASRSRSEIQVHWLQLSKSCSSVEEHTPIPRE